MSRAGNFEIEVWKGGHPVWCHLSYGDKKISHIHHTDLQDLKYAVDRAIKEARDALPDSHKHEMD